MTSKQLILAHLGLIIYTRRSAFMMTEYAKHARTSAEINLPWTHTQWHITSADYAQRSEVKNALKCKRLPFTLKELSIGIDDIILSLP